VNGTSFNFGRARAVARKEVWHILRDPFTLAMALGLPLVLVAIFGVAIDFDIKNVNIGIDDRDHTHASRELVQVFQNTGAFDTIPVAPHANPEALLRSERMKGVLIIEPQFQRHLATQATASAQLLLDGADNTTAGTILSYLGGIQDAANAKFAGTVSAPTVALETRFLYNPELNTPLFIIPGLTVVVIAIISILLTALTVAREWENGSMELLLSTPVQPVELIAGKLAPYTVIGLLAIAFIYVAARVGFGVPFRGSHLVFLAGSLLFLSAYLAQGLLISVLTRRQQIAMQFAIVSGLLPSILLSGFIFPIESMPRFFHYFTAVFPARWFMSISRDLFLKGTDFRALAVPFAALLVLNVILLTLATKRFKKDLEP
jgi:ABC-2 type transport system permease protein